MKDKRWIIALASASVLIGAFALLALTPVSFAKKGGKGKPITWSVNPVQANVAPGDTFNATVSFTSNIDLDNVTLDVTRSLSATTTISPTTFASVLAGVPYNVDITFAAPATGDQTQYNGVVHLRTGHKNHPTNLKLRFRVGAGGTETPEPTEIPTP